MPEARATAGVGTARAKARAREMGMGMGREPGEPQGWGMALAPAPGWATALALALGWATALAPAPGWVTAPAPGQAGRALAPGWGWEMAPAPGMARAPRAWAMGPQPTQAAVTAAANVFSVQHIAQQAATTSRSHAGSATRHTNLALPANMRQWSFSSADLGRWGQSALHGNSTRQQSRAAVRRCILNASAGMSSRH